MQQCNFIDWRNFKIVYKRYASLYFVCTIDADDNELVTLDMIHHFVEVLDKHFSNVCELDLVFHFYKAYWLMDEVFLAGNAQLDPACACATCLSIHAAACCRIMRTTHHAVSMKRSQSFISVPCSRVNPPICPKAATAAAGEMQEPNKRAACLIVKEQDDLVEEQHHGAPF